MSSLRKAHFYRRVPKELTEGNALGGVVSLVGILCSAFLVYSNAASYFTTAVRTKLVLDLNTEDHIELAFNITMEGLPCRFMAIDFFDVTGTKRLNISRDIMKVRRPGPPVSTSRAAPCDASSAAPRSPSPPSPPVTSHAPATALPDAAVAARRRRRRLTPPSSPEGARLVDRRPHPRHGRRRGVDQRCGAR